jgi:hypothetical protein
LLAAFTRECGLAPEKGPNRLKIALASRRQAEPALWGNKTTLRGEGGFALTRGQVAEDMGPAGWLEERIGLLATVEITWNLPVVREELVSKQPSAISCPAKSVAARNI